MIVNEQQVWLFISMDLYILLITNKSWLFVQFMVCLELKINSYISWLFFLMYTGSFLWLTIFKSGLFFSVDG